VLAQSETDAERLCALGCTAQAVSVSGNLKFDVRAAQEVKATRQLRSLASGLRLIVAGSTLEGEEAVLLEAWPNLLKADPKLLLVLAPRHPERFTAVAGLLNRSGLNWVRRSEWSSSEPIQPLHPGEIVLLDSIGELASVYSLASVAFVGGSLIPAGGHNALEPAQFAVPIVIGPNYANFRAITEDLLAQQALRIAAKDELATVMAELLQDSAAAQAMGMRAKMVFDRQAGATSRSLAALLEVLGSPIVKVKQLAEQFIRQGE
jgi:3-deoxy-D-manno-octulosonic-acid transferase